MSGAGLIPGIGFNEREKEPCPIRGCCVVKIKHKSVCDDENRIQEWRDCGVYTAYMERDYQHHNPSIKNPILN